MRVRLLYKDKLVSITLFCTIDSAVLFFAKELNLRTGSINDANIDFNVSIPFMQFNIKNQQFTVPSNQDLEFDNQFVNNIIANSSTRASNKKDAETFRNYIVYSLISITCINSDCSLKLGQRQNNQQSYRKADNIASNKPHSIIFRQNAISRSFNIENRKDAVIRTADQSKAEQITIPLIQSVKMNGVKNNNKLFLIDQYQQVITVLTAFLMTNMNVNKKFDTVYSKSTDNITYNKLFSALTDSIETSNEHVNEDNTMITNTVSDECNEYTEEKFIFDIIKDNIRNEDKKIVKNYIKCNNENIEVNDAINIIKALIRINRTKVLEQKLYQVLEYVISTINEQIFDNADTFSQAIDIFETIVNETLIELITSKQILPVFLSIIIKEQQYAPLIVLLLGSKFIDNELFKIFTTYKIENGDTIHSMVLQFIYESKCDECFDVTALAMHLLRTYNIKGVNDNAIIECDEFFDVTASAIYLLRAYNIKGVNNTAIIECVFAISSIAKSNGINLINELIKYQLDDGNTVFSILLKYIEEQKSCNLVNSICKSLRNIDKEKDEDMELCKKIFTESIDTLLSAALEYAKVKNDCKPILNIIKISETVEKLCPGLYNKLIDYKTLCGDTLQSVILKYITQNFHGNPKDYITTIEVATEFLFFSSKKDIEFVQQFLNFKIDEDNEKNVISIWHAILEYLAIDEYDLELQPKYNIVWLIFNILINIKEKDTESKFSAELINYSTPYGETFFSVISKLIKASSTEIEKRKDSITMYQTEIYKEELIPKKTGFHQECPILKEFINISRLKANLADELQDYEILKQCEEFIKEIVVELVHIFHAFMDDAFGEIVNHAIGKNSELFLNILEFINISKEVSGNLEKEIEELYNYIIVILAECDTKYLSKETFNNVLCFQDKKHQPFFATRANFLELQHKNMDKKTDQEEISNMIRNRIIGIIHILQHEYTDLKIFKKSFGNQNLNNCIKWLQKHEHTIMTPPIAEITKYMIRLRDNIEKLDFTTTENTNIELNIDDYLQPGTSEVTKEKDITNAKMFSSGSSEDEIFSGSSEDEEINYMGG
ncbi:rRNA processing/ribosome biogenesis family protein [Orientia chuto str. Dubai]|uniref:rRNA processing/ribosome biogenesis family protein n=1 Tax=Orientia chuto str. Dubai TaxID=1359168 RepID=A0A0F3MLS9_9RICK|nr:hypothetical protein [Candidatus Orientia mediorientalis]KJV56437.1 rRNA processing/ribosome biogenesis family protein [Orientia chuto str. Dubai]